MAMKKLAYGQHELTSNGKNLVDLIRDQSVNFSKNHQYTTDDGHLKGVLVDITVQYDGTSTTGRSVSLLGMRNTWKLRNAVRKFHFLRNHMFREAGISRSEMGTYGKTMRPYLDALHAGSQESGTGDETVEMSSVITQWKPADPVTDAGSYSETEAEKLAGVGFWARSTFGTVPSYRADASGDAPEEDLGPVDEWTLTLANPYMVEDTSSEGVTVSYKSVGAIHAYNIDRQAVQVQEDDTSIDGPNNPLAQLQSAGNQATGEILEIAEAQEEMPPPYSLVDDGTSIDLSVLDTWQFPTTKGTHTFRNIFVPAGMFRFMTDANDDFTVNIEVLGEFECRDFA
jgi:hypothetical protein